MEFKAITTQEEFDRMIQERLSRQKESMEKQYADYAEVKARNAELELKIGVLESTLSEASTKNEGYDKEIAGLIAKVADYETANLRTKIALQHGIPYDLAGRLVGEDEASLTADAKKLADLVGNKEPIAPLKNMEPKGDSETEAYKSLIENLNLGGE